VQGLLNFFGVPSTPPFIDEDTVLLGPNHNLSGNPNRFDRGPVRIRVDREWSEQMARRDRTVIGAATLPFLLRYRYPIGGAGRPLLLPG
jgi:hypothetical protein